MQQLASDGIVAFHISLPENGVEANAAKKRARALVDLQALEEPGFLLSTPG